ncbi:MAG TPA: enoyl-CoA hydratase-related protein [Geminicoccaceae bacterium]
MSAALVLRAVDERGVATVTLNRPEVSNAYNEALLEALQAAVGDLATDPGVRVVVLRGAGRHFQAGADLAWLKEVGGYDLARNVEMSLKTTRAVQALNVCAKPTVALVHGACYGGGVGLVAACDVAIATVGATFALTEVRFGLIPAPIIPQLVAALGVRALRRYGITGERFDAAAAERIGLVHEICPAGGLDEAVAPLIDALLRSAPSAVERSKRMVLEEAGLDLSERRIRALAVEGALKRASPEAAEGLSSFLEKRQPAWYRGDRS